jgi:hypothetical protein
MKRLLSTGLSLLVGGFLASHAQAKPGNPGGAAKRVAQGLFVSPDPEPYRTSTGVVFHGVESGPVKLRFITDRRTYPQPKTSSKNKDRIESRGSLGTRSQESRVRRLFR